MLPVPSIPSLVLIVLLWLVASASALAFAYRRDLRSAWREPVLRAPVLILESDDWGYGPEVQAERLERIASLLAGFTDHEGRHPVMTLGVVLAGPNTSAMRATDCRTYHRVGLDDMRLVPVRDALLRGAAHGVFALQLHGREHYWPESLMAATKSDALIRDWLTGPEFPATEALPAPLQSRWMDAATLPSNPLSAKRIAEEASAEVRSFAQLLGATPEVAVPPTFAWTPDVESAWSLSGIRVIVTPGRRGESRDAAGSLVYSDDAYFNGAVGSDGLIYVVRDTYFEPAKGHTHERALDDMRVKARAGRPALLEIHRSNFIGAEGAASAACDELRRLLQAALAAWPNLRFMSTADLAAHYRERSALVDERLRERVHVALRRLVEVSRLRKLTWITGAIALAWLVYVLSSRIAGGRK